MKLNYKQTFLIGFGFFASSMAWSMFNNYVPVLLEKYLASTFLIGLVMVIDNIFGVIFQPIFGAISDKTRTRFGRRMPYIMVGIPICAVTFSLIPFTWSLATLVCVVIVFNFVMSTWRAPVVALMPDMTPRPLRSQANGIINLMGGLGTLIALGAGGVLYKISATLFGDGGMYLPFITGGVVMVLALIIMKLFVHEEKNRLAETEESEKEEPAEQSQGKSKSLIFLLFAILAWFFGYNAIETFFSLYVTNTLKDSSGAFLTAGDSSLLLGIFSLTFMVFAVPAGFISAKIGRKRTILIGLAGLSILFLIMMFIGNLLTLGILLVFGGVFWACVNINSLPMVVEMAKWKDIGRYTGYYYLFSFGAAIGSPLLFGIIRDLFRSYEILFVYCPIAFILAFVCMLFVRHGEAKPVAKNAAEILDNADM